MCESKTTHLYPSIKSCLVCGKKLNEWYRKRRTVKSLTGPQNIVSHIFNCQNKKCVRFRCHMIPEEETKLAIKGYTYGLDVILKIGILRYQEYKTWEQIKCLLDNHYNLNISYREIGYLEEAFLTLTNYVAKNDKSVLYKLKSLDGLVIAIDGIAPERNSGILYLVREIQTGFILAAKIISCDYVENLKALLREIIDLNMKILGIVSDKEAAIMSAIDTIIPNVPHQLCHYHFLKNISAEAIEKDRSLKKWISSNISKEVSKIIKFCAEEENCPDKEKNIINDYCFVLRTLLKRKSLYPLKPGGLILYKEILHVQESINGCLVYKEDKFLKRLSKKIQFIIDGSKKLFHKTQTAYEWIYRIASFIDHEDKVPEEEKKKKLLNIIDLFQHGNDFELRNMLVYIQNITKYWIHNLFKFCSQPLIPKTNNNLEVFNSRVRKIYRKITGHKKTQNFIERYGANVAFLIGILGHFNLKESFHSVPYQDFRNARDSSFRREIQRFSV